MFTLNPDSMPGIDDATNMLKIIPIIINTIPKYKQFLALFGSSLRKIKNAMIPPTIPKNIGNKNHVLLLAFTG